MCLLIADGSLMAITVAGIFDDRGMSYVGLTILDFAAGGSRGAGGNQPPRKISGIRSVNSFASGVLNGHPLVIYRSRETLSSNLRLLVAIKTTELSYKWEQPQRRTLDRINTFGGGKEESSITGLFREYAKIPLAKGYEGINFFNNSTNLSHSKIAMATHSNFEMISFREKTISESIPDFKRPDMASIAARLEVQKPLGMFAVSVTEYLCYQNCGIYVTKPLFGDSIKNSACVFLGEAKSAAAYDNYLVLFHDDFVEIRELDSSRLKQVITGKDIRCLDDGTRGPKAQVPLRTLKFAMMDPKKPQCHIMLAMVLNDQNEGAPDNRADVQDTSPRRETKEPELPSIVVTDTVAHQEGRSNAPTLLEPEGSEDAAARRRKRRSARTQESTGSVDFT